jgi:hypothetical protein
MNLASLQTITWGTVTAAVSSALLLASIGGELRPIESRLYRNPSLRAEPRLPATAPAAVAARPVMIRTAAATPPR